MADASFVSMYGNYYPFGDLIVLAICILILVLVRTSYISRTKSFMIFLIMIALLVASCVTSIIFHYSYNQSGFPDSVKYISRFLYRNSLLAYLALYIYYITIVQNLNTKTRKVFAYSGFGLFIIAAIIDVIGSVVGFGFEVNQPETEKTSYYLFLIFYVLFMLLVVFLLVKYRDRIYRQVMDGFYGTMLISFAVLYLQGRFDQVTFLTATFIFPLISMLYLIHANPYSVDVGAINISALKELVDYCYSANHEFMVISLYMKYFDEEGKHFPEELQRTIRKFGSDYFKGAVLFQVTNGHVMMIADMTKNRDYDNKVNIVINEFEKEYKRFQYDYKVIIGKSIDEISKKNEYISFLKHIQNRMAENTLHFIDYDDLTTFNKQKYILDELADIYKRKDMNDPRVLVYCQPVFNINRNKFDTAEALMRLKLPQIDMVFPDQFIPLAEENDYIHVLSMILLNKTCNQIRKLIVGGYDVTRISVNISVQELRYEDFCNDINKIIKSSSIPDDKVAIEITESLNEEDFPVMQEKINELKEKGIRFYLDDFGTGYSNIERIMELPFDIIKFDRSLVIASGDSEKSAKMVESMAKMFSDMEYSVLYEGVENDLDENRCKNMSAEYLQGYKYSRPIPIEYLVDFFEKKTNDEMISKAVEKAEETSEETVEEKAEETVEEKAEETE